MHLNEAQTVAAPVVVVVIRALLIPLAAIAGYFVAWGVAFAASYFVRGLYKSVDNVIGWIPGVNRLVHGPLLSAEHQLVHWLGDLESRFEHQFASRWHAVAALVRQYARDTEAAAVFDWHIARKVATFWGNSATGGLVKRAHEKANHANATATNAVNTATRANHQARAARQAIADTVPVARPLPHAIPQTRPVIERVYVPGKVGARVGSLEGEVGHLVDWTIPRLRDRTKALEDGFARAYRLIRAHATTLEGVTFAAAVAVALGRLGGGWIRCQNWNRLGKSVCRLPLGLIEELLAASVVAFAVMDICRFATLAQRAAQEFVPVLLTLVDVEDALIGCHGATGVPTLHVAAYQVPPNSLDLPLAA